MITRKSSDPQSAWCNFSSFAALAVSGISAGSLSKPPTCWGNFPPFREICDQVSTPVQPIDQVLKSHVLETMQRLSGNENARRAAQRAWLLSRQHNRQNSTADEIHSVENTGETRIQQFLYAA